MLDIRQITLISAQFAGITEGLLESEKVLTRSCAIFAGRSTISCRLRVGKRKVRANEYSIPSRYRHELR